MTPATTDAHRPVWLDEAELSELRSRPGLQILDQAGHGQDELRRLQPPPTADELAEPSRWAYFPWRNAVVRLPGPAAYRRIRTDRNRNKITGPEQDRLGALTIGVVGLSVGHAIAHTIALEGLCGELRLADFDTIELSNLNRIPAGVFDLGINKAVVTARRIAELDPYLPVRVLPDGLTDASMDEFFDGLDLVIEECDSLDIKVRVREEARQRGIPVIMETSDRGLFDVERYDQEPSRPLFHGLLGDVDAGSLHGLPTRDKAPHVMRILQASQLSARMAASMVEIDRTVSTWPQLGGDIALGASMVATAVRRFGRGQRLPSGRIRVDLEESFDRLDPALIPGSSIGSDRPATDLTVDRPAEALDAVVHAIRLAPSGGNVQPWAVAVSGSTARISLVPERTSAMDQQFRGSYVAIGAAAFNARVAAAAHGHGSDVVVRMEGDSPVASVEVTLADRVDPSLAGLYPGMIRRISNRNLGRRAPLTDSDREQLNAAAAAEGGFVRFVEDPERLGAVADILAESDRLRYLTPLLHAQMMSELRWPGRDRLELGIDVRTLGLDDIDLAKLEVAGRPEVMKLLADWDGGAALGDSTRDRVKASSAVVVVAMPGDRVEDYVRGGSAVERVWIEGERLGLGVQPVSPVFLYARDGQDLQNASAPFHHELGVLAAAFADLVGLAAGQAPMLVLRLSHDAGRPVRSERLPLAEVLTSR